MRFPEEVENDLINLSDQRRILLEGNILKILETDSEKFKNYIESAKENDKSNRKKRLEITRQVQDQNKELAAKADENEKLMDELKEALNQADEAKEAALNDLDLLQKRTQFELIGTIVRVALWIIAGVGVATTLLYVFALFLSDVDATLIGNTWSNLFGILLTNSFSIIGTIMGVKYASGDSKGDNK